MTTTPRMWTDAEIVAYTARAEVRAILLHETRQPVELHAETVDALDAGDGYLHAFEVETKGDDGQTYTVLAYVDAAHPGAPVVIRCTCPSGIYRGDALAVPCWHAAAVGRQLEIDGHARRAAWGWVTRGTDVCPECGAGTPVGAFDYAHTPDCPDHVADPFADL